MTSYCNLAGSGTRRSEDWLQYLCCHPPQAHSSTYSQSHKLSKLRNDKQRWLMFGGVKTFFVSFISHVQVPQVLKFRCLKCSSSSASSDFDRSLMYNRQIIDISFFSLQPAKIYMHFWPQPIKHQSFLLVFSCVKIAGYCSGRLTYDYWHSIITHRTSM